MSNRIFKFRCWCKVEKKFTQYPEFPSPDLVGMISFQSYPNRYIWQQSTSLLDKDKKEIYEGDIVRHDRYDGIIIIDWDKFYNGFCEKFILKDRRMKPVLEPLCSDSKLKIIGNIFENPELLD